MFCLVEPLCDLFSAAQEIAVFAESQAAAVPMAVFIGGLLSLPGTQMSEQLHESPLD